MIDVYMYMHTDTYFERASHFWHEQASLEILWESICSHSCLDIVIYNKKIVFVLTKYGNSSSHVVLLLWAAPILPQLLW